MRRLILTLVLFCMLVGVPLASAQDDAPATDGVAVTVYNQGTALVQDRRTFNLDAGINTVNFTDVASSIDPTSVSFTSLTDPTGTIVMEQNYVYDLVNSSALLAKYLDESIVVTVTDGTVYTGQLLSGRNNEIILKTETDEVAVINAQNVRDISFPALPEGLITRPTLRWLISSAQSGEQAVELTYLTGGMNWSADYIVLLDQEGTSLDLNGWITLNNTSGTSYKDAQLKLIAGDVNRAPAPAPLGRTMAVDEDMVFAAQAEVQQREFFEYQLYEIPRPVTIANNETKQVEFVTGADVPSNTFFVYDGGPQWYGYYSVIQDQYYGQTGVTDVQNWLEFTTDEDQGVGADLPAGRIRVYQEDIDGAALLIGENYIDHTPQGEDVQIYLGNAFDLVGERTQTDFRIITGRVITETYEIKLRNRKDDETVQIRVPERLFRWSNWEILETSHSYEKLNSNSIEFRVDVAPDEEVVITYTVQYSWPR